VFDRLPARLSVEVLGSTGAEGEVFKGRFDLPLQEPEIEPLNPEDVVPEEGEDEEEEAPAEVTT
jgi:hypothetical protein